MKGKHRVYPQVYPIGCKYGELACCQFEQFYDEDCEKSFQLFLDLALCGFFPLQDKNRTFTK